MAEESARLSANQLATGNTNSTIVQTLFPFQTQQHFTNPPQTHMSLHPWDPPPPQQNPNPNSINNNNNNPSLLLHQIKPEEQLEPHHFHIPQTYFHNHNHNHHHHKALINSPFQTLSNPATSAHLSATALLQKAATVGLASTANAAQQAQSVGHMISSAEFGTPSHHHHQIQMDPVVSHMISSSSNDQYNIADQFTSRNLATWHKTDRLTRDFLGLTDIAGNGNVTTNNTATNTTSTGHGHGHGHVNVSINVKNMLSYTDGVGFPHQQQHYNERDHTSVLNMKSQGFGLADPSSETWGDC